MTSAQVHYEHAEALLHELRHDALQREDRLEIIAEAQVHATLALVRGTA
jgi:hypothetical protein